MINLLTHDPYRILTTTECFHSSNGIGKDLNLVAGDCKLPVRSVVTICRDCERFNSRYDFIIDSFSDLI